MLRAEEFDEIAADATAVLAQSPTVDDAYFAHYYRGCALWRLGLLDEARADMAAIVGAEDVYPDRFPAPQWYLDTIAEQKARLPPVRREVSVDGVPCFTVYADREDVALAQLLELLPVAVNSVRRVTNAPPRRTVVMLFGSVAKMQAYEDIPHPTPPIADAILAHGGPNGVHICLSREPGKYVTDPRGGYFRLSVTHEYLHVMVDRIVENHADLPLWFAEGLANVAGLHSAQAEEATFAGRFKESVDHHAVLSLPELNGRGFYKMANDSFGGRGFADPYAQATEMTEYLLLGRPQSVVADLLAAVRRTNNFDQAFAQTFGETVEQFYADWRAYAVR